MHEPQSDWKQSKQIAKSWLRDRKQRRKIGSRFLLFVLIWLGLGLWGIDEWLEQSSVRFLAYWALCAGLCFALVIYALYDALSVIREERAKNQ